jgi:rhodanese-related sulfurtransferase/rubrerythrin
MFYKNLFRAPIKKITADQTKTLISTPGFDRYQLVDVRQPGEYEQGHIPGARLIPLGDIPSRVSELDSEKKTIVYCRSGVRSESACRILTRLGIKSVSNMEGGILAYQGGQAEGNVDSGIELFVGKDFASVYELAFTMEAGLKNFYLTLADEADDREDMVLLNRLAKFEDSHMTKLRARFGEVSFDPDTAISEGGMDIEAMIAHFGDQLKSRERILQLAMKLEAQAFDLYSRLAQQQKGEDTESFYQSMADEERQHLLIVSRMLDALI